MKARNHAESRKREVLWQKQFDARTAAFEKGRQAVIDRYDKMEVDERVGREKQRQQMEAQRDKLLAEKERTKEVRQKVLEAERVRWVKQKEAMEIKILKIRESYQQMEAQRMPLAEKDKDDARTRKVEVDKKYQQTIENVNAAMLKQIKSRFSREFTEDAARDNQLTETTKRIDSMMAESHARIGYDALSKNDLAEARKFFVDALYFDKDNASAKTGMKSINEKAAAMYWEAYGMKDTNKQQSVRILQTLIRSLLPMDEFFLKSGQLLDELR
jgi:hypothetical protein